MKVLKGYVRNRYRPEGCIAECFIAEEAVEFCLEFLSEIKTIGIPTIKNMASNDIEYGSILYGGRPLPGGQVVSVDRESWEQAHRYVLQNAPEIQPYIE